jgi:hypothetical protein
MFYHLLLRKVMFLRTLINIIIRINKIIRESILVIKDSVFLLLIIEIKIINNSLKWMIVISQYQYQKMKTIDNQQ